MKKIIFTLLVLLMTAATGAWADNLYFVKTNTETKSATLMYGTPPSDVYYNNNNGGSWETGADSGWWWDLIGYYTSITIDESCKGYTGTTLRNLFQYFESLTSISGFENLNTANVTDMQYMFNNCRSLVTLDLSAFNVNNVTSFKGMFAGCVELQTLNLSSWNTSNATDMSNMFYYCPKLETITFGSSWNTSNVTNMNHMFSECSSLGTLILDSGWDTSSVTDMNHMFDCCYNLGTLTLGSGWDTSSVTDMSGIFADCSSLVTLDLSGWDTSNVTNMEEMFWYCSKLETLNIIGWNTSSVTNSTSMFAGCTKLKKSVTLNAGATGEYWATFYDVCNYQAPTGTEVYAITLSNGKLTKTQIADGIVKSGQSVLLKSTSASITMSPTTTAGSGDWTDNSLKGTTTSIPNPGNAYVLDNDTKGLGFYKLSATGTIAANNAYLTSNSQSDFFSLGGDEPEQPTVVASGECGDGVTYSLTSDGKLTISGTGAMTDYAHYSLRPWNENAETITSVVIGEGVTSIGESAFSQCSNLTSITLPASLTTIGEYAFESSGLTSISLPANVTTIGEAAFADCSDLISVTFADESQLETINDGTFSGCSNLTSITLPASVTTIGESAFAVCSSLTSISLPASLTSIGSSAFIACSALTSITLPASVTTIGNFAFLSSGLTSISIPASMTNIGSSAFAGSPLTSVTVNAPSCTLGVDAFDGCSSSLNIYVPSDKVNDYKTAENWSTYEAKIKAIPATYKVTLNDGNVDTNNWNITPATATTDGVAAGQTVTLKYNGKKKVKSVKAVKKEAGPVAYEQCPDDHHPHWIDLGLPSGTLWQCCNEGATAPEGYGDYYNYNDALSHNAPTKDQINELLANTTSEWTTLNDVNGRWFTSTTNGGKVFLPAAGGRWDTNYYNAGIYGRYWSSALTEGGANYAYFLSFSSGEAGWKFSDCFDGLSVRPVRGITGTGF